MIRKFITVARLRWAVQIGALVILVGLGAAGVRRVTARGYEVTLPTLSCEYVQSIAKCFLFDLQRELTQGRETHYRGLLGPGFFFLGLGLLLGKAWCGWICPLGFLQDLSAKLRTCLGLPYRHVSQRGQSFFGYVAHGLLGLMAVLSLLIGWSDSKLYAYRSELFRPFCQICPAKRLFPLVGGKGGCLLAIDSLSPLTQVLSCLSLVALGTFLTGSFLIKRFWCRICPLGLLFKLSGLNRFSLVELHKEVAACTACGQCAAACSLDLRLVQERREADVTAAECDFCLECVTACPRPNVLQLRFLGWTLGRSQGRGAAPRDTAMSEEEAVQTER